jgi:hypothetical protein
VARYKKTARDLGAARGAALGAGAAPVYQVRVYGRRKGEARGFTWQDYWDLIIAAHHNLSAPLIWVWDNLNIHLAPELADFAMENEAWLRACRE